MKPAKVRENSLIKTLLIAENKIEISIKTKIKMSEEIIDKICPHCGASMKEWKHSLTPGLVDILVSFIEAVKNKKENKIHLQVDLNLNKNQYNNFQKLRYFGLVAKVRNDDGSHLAGYWLITRLGGEFLRREKAIPMWIKTFRNSIEEKSEELIFINDIYHRDFPIVWFQNQFDFDISQGKLF